MTKNFIIFGTILCVLLAYANHTGWIVANSVMSGKWGPKGQNSYHK